MDAVAFATSSLCETSIGKMWSMTLTYLCALLGAIGVDAQYGDWHGDSMSGGGTYTNPILNKTGADP